MRHASCVGSFALYLQMSDMFVTLRYVLHKYVVSSSAVGKRLHSTFDKRPSGIRERNMKTFLCL